MFSNDIKLMNFLLTALTVCVAHWVDTFKKLISVQCWTEWCAPETLHNRYFRTLQTTADWNCFRAVHFHWMWQYTCQISYQENVQVFICNSCITGLPCCNHTARISSKIEESKLKTGSQNRSFTQREREALPQFRISTRLHWFYKG